MLIDINRYLGQRVSESREGRKGRYTLCAERGQECERRFSPRPYYYRISCLCLLYSERAILIEVYIYSRYKDYDNVLREDFVDDFEVAQG